MKLLSKKTNQPKKDLYQEVTDRIIEALEKGTVPWRKPWKTDGKGKTVPFGIPANACSGHVYNGVNVLLLWLEQMEKGYASSRWLTYRQACQAGGNVKKGEHATMVVWYKEFLKQSKDEQGQMVFDEEGHPVLESFCVLKHHLVFNVSQCENLPDDIAPAGVIPESFAAPDENKVNAEAYNRIVRMIQSLGVRVSNQKIDMAFYRSCTDEIVLPKAIYFLTESNYLSTALHEMVHATGHERRLNRIGITSQKRSFGDEVYAFEELIAEIGSAFACAALGVTGELQHESYVDHWLNIMKADKKAIIRASKQARLASELLFSFEQEESPEEAKSRSDEREEEALAA
ncbi:ArdC family protein [Saezia sanguinis]|uniref:ArdC family protein n=1 Tax=Saezia sanguinis TaxID=1965230 RepID=UPI0030225229